MINTAKIVKVLEDLERKWNEASKSRATPEWIKRQRQNANG